MKRPVDDRFSWHRRHLVAVLLALVLFLRSAGVSKSAETDVVKVRIAEYGNGNAVRLLLLEMGRRLKDVSRNALPVWMTLDVPDSSADFDMLITSDETCLRKLGQRGVSLDCRPIFLDELILVGPDAAPFPKSDPVEVVLQRIHAGGLPFFSLMNDGWIEERERSLWSRSGIGRPQENRSYVESGRDEVSALMQSSDEGAFLLVSESAFAAYQGAQRGVPGLSKFAGSGIYRTCYACVVLGNEKSKAEHRSVSALYAAWLDSPAGRGFVEDFALGGMKPFKAPQEGSRSLSSGER